MEFCTNGNFNRISVVLIVIVIRFWASKVGTHLGYARWASKVSTFGYVLGTFGYVSIFLVSSGQIWINAIQFVTILFTHCECSLTGISLQNILFMERLMTRQICMHLVWSFLS